MKTRKILEVVSRQRSAGLALRYPTLATVLASVFGGYRAAQQAADEEADGSVDKYLFDFIVDSHLSSIDLSQMEIASKKYLPRIKRNGIPFPGNDHDWDALVNQDNGLQKLQKLIAEWD
jgi:hypothetical protein